MRFIFASVCELHTCGNNTKNKHLNYSLMFKIFVNIRIIFLFYNKAIQAIIFTPYIIA